MTLLFVNLFLACCSCAAFYVEWRLIRIRIRERAKVQARLAAAAGAYHQLVGGPRDGLEIPAEVSQRLIRVKYFQPPEELDYEVPAGFGLIALQANRAANYVRSPKDVGQPGPCLYHFSGIDVLGEEKEEVCGGCGQLLTDLEVFGDGEHLCDDCARRAEGK